MARRPFGGTPADYVIDATGAPQPGRDEQGATLVEGTVWTAQTAGTQITDLLDLTGAAIEGGIIIPGNDGRLPRFLGPDDGTASVWVEFDGGPRHLLLSTDHPERILALETGGVQAAGQQYPASAVVFSSTFRSSRPATNAGQYTWTCDGVGDQVEINAAIAAVAAAGGGRVELQGPRFYINGPIQKRTGVWLQGEGQGTIILATGAFAAGMVTLLDNAVHATKLSDLTLDGGGLAVPAGIHYSATGGQIFTSDPATNPDPNHIIGDLYIRRIGNGSTAGYGMRMQGGNLRGGKYSKIRIQNATGCGIWIDSSVDSHYTDIEIGSSGSGGPAYSVSTTAPVGHGVFVDGDQNSLLGVKGWYSRGAGIYLRAVRCRLTACEGQDNYSYGIHVTHGKNTITNCHADSNGQANGADGRGRAGWFLSGDSLTVVGCTSYDKAEGQTAAWAQQHGFQLSSGLTYSRVTACTTYGNEVASVLGSAGTGTTVDIQAGADGR